jgi:hypothetical protein
MVAMAAGVAAPSRAQESGDLQRGVARISLIDGQVSVRRGDSGDWVAGAINAPLMADDSIAAGPNSRAEVELDSSTVLYLGGATEIHLAALEYGRFQIELAHGTLSYRILAPSNTNSEVDTPSISVRPQKPGTYRITVKDDGDSEVVARAGEVEVFTPRGSEWIKSGQMMVARGSSSAPVFQILTANPYDEWDRWCDSRSQAIVQSPSAQYVPQGVYGTEDLDNSGSWVDYPEYGHVWRPSVDANWAPYSCGHWVWEEWYGWTWVGCESWGWAPYHYGRWFYGANYGWLWYPGRLGVRHYWSPALVGFFGYGGGAGFGLGFGYGNVGWVALAPYEVFHPWWGRGYYGHGGFNRGFDFVHGNVSGAYRNARIGNGVVGVSATDFQSGRFHNIMRPRGEQLRSAGMVHGAMAIVPTSANLHFAGRQASYVPRGNESQRFFSHQQAPAVEHAPYFQQQRVANGLGNSRSMERGGGPAAPGPAMNRPQPGAGGAAGWRRFGQSEGAGGGAPNSANGPASGFRGAQAPNAGGGYQRFGEPGAGRGSEGPANAPRYNAPPARNDRPSYNQQAPRYNQPAGGYGQQAPRYNAPPQQQAPHYNNAPPQQQAPRYNAPAQQAPRYNAPPQREAPRYNAPPQQQAPRYNAPQQRYNAPAPHYNAPQSAPHYSAPSHSGGGGGGGGHPSGGGGGHRR